MTALFGHLDDEMGQKTTFITTLLMVVTTFLMGLLPTYAEIGLAAPVLLSTLRILQGISLGIYMIGLLFATATHYPLHLRLAGVKDVALVSFGVFVPIIATVFTFNMLDTTLAELFPTRVRYTAMSIAFN